MSTADDIDVSEHLSWNRFQRLPLAKEVLAESDDAGKLKIRELFEQAFRMGLLCAVPLVKAELGRMQ